MPALADNFSEILKGKLRVEFVPRLPALLNKTAPPDQQDAKQLSRALSAFVLHKLLDLSVVEACASVVDDFDDNGIDALAYVDRVLYCVQVKLKNKSFDETDALKFRNGLSLLIKGQFNAFNENVKKRAKELEQAMDDCDAIRLVVGFTGSGVTEHAKNVLAEFHEESIDDEPRLDKDIVEFSAEKLEKALLDEKALGTVNATIPFSKLHMVSEPKATYFGVVRLNDLIKLHQDHSRALYERNIRYFLGTKSSNVNQAIQETLKTNAAGFFYLNNGITVLADIVEKKGTAGNPKLKMRGLSVINGAQTISSAADYAKNNPNDDLSAAKVLLTVIQADSDGSFGRSVTKARNHQNPVTAGNFAALDPVQEDLRRELDYLGYSYHYRPEALPIGADKDEHTITIDVAMRALAIFCTDSRFPYLLKNDFGRFQQIGSPEYAALFEPIPKGATLVNKVKCYRFIRDVLAANDTTGGEDGERLFYRHGAYTVGHVLAKRLLTLVSAPAVMTIAEITNAVSLPLDQCRQTCWDNAKGHVGTRNSVLAYFRNQGNTVDLLERCMAAVYQLSGTPELAAVKAQSAVDEKYPRERVFRYLVAMCPKV